MSIVFGFWTRGIGPHGHDFPRQSLESWLSYDRSFKVFGDDEVVSSLDVWSKQIQELYLDIRIPACRADIARLALLYRHGGTYVDAHTGPGDYDALRHYLGLIESHEMVIPQFDPQESPISYNRIYNSPISGRAGAVVLEDLLRRSFGNLLHHRDTERGRQTIDLQYSIFDLTGPNMIRDKIVDLTQWPRVLFPFYEKSVHFVDLSRCGNGPFQLYRYRDYRRGENHWTLREKSEPLFFSSQTL